MAKLKVTWMGSTSIEGKAEHESGDLLAIGADVLERGIVIDNVWTHPSLVKQISLIHEPVLPSPAAAESGDTESETVLTDGDEPAVPGGSDPVEPSPVTEPVTGTVILPPSDPAASVPDASAAIGGLGGPPSASAPASSAPTGDPATTK
jgi:hypothetical protein